MATTDDLAQRMELSLAARRAIIRLTHSLKTEGEIPHAGAISAFIAGVHNDAASDQLFPRPAARQITCRIEKLIAALDQYEIFCGDLEPVLDEIAQRTQASLDAYFANVATWYTQDALNAATTAEPNEAKPLIGALEQLAAVYAGARFAAQTRPIARPCEPSRSQPAA
jgi:hypothetical protein